MDYSIKQQSSDLSIVLRRIQEILRDIETRLATLEEGNQQ